MATESDVNFCFSQIAPALHLRETEDSWKKIDQALNKLEEITKKGAYKHDVYTSLIKENGLPIVSALLSERTKLSGSAADLIMSLAPRLAGRFDPLVSTFVPPLIQICGRTNKVAIARAKKCLILISKHCRLPSLLPYLREGAQSRSSTLRNISIEVMLNLLESAENADASFGRRVGDIEHVIRLTATDRDPEVRQWCRKTFDLYIVQWPGRVTDFTAAFTPTTRKYLAISSARTMDAENKRPTESAPSASASAFKQYRKPLQRVQPITSARTPSLDRGPLDKLSAAIDTRSERKPYTESTEKVGLSGKASSSELRAAKAGRARTASKTESHSARKKTAAPTVVVSETPSSVAIFEAAMEPASEDLEVEKERATLRAEVAKMSSTTPSRGIAARLALQHFEMRHQAPNGQADGKPRAALTAFAVAASKKSSPRRMPARVPRPHAPIEQQKARDTSQEGLVMPQRIAIRTQEGSTAYNTSPVKTSSVVLTDSVNKRPCSPDVFDSRPILKDGQPRWNVSGSANRTVHSKKVSTTSRGLSAKSHLIGGRGDFTTIKTHKKASAATEIIRAIRPEVTKERFFPDLEEEQTEEARLNGKSVPAASIDPVAQTAQTKPIVSLSTLLARKLQLTHSKKM